MKQILIARGVDKSMLWLAVFFAMQIQGGPKRLSGSEPLRMSLVISFASNRPIATPTQIDSIVTVNDVKQKGMEETFAIP